MECTEPIRMMLPPLPEAIMARMAARLVRNPASRCTAMTLRQSENEKSCNGATICTPALLTSTSRPPSSLVMRTTAASTPASSVTSSPMASARPPCCTMASATVCAAAAFISTTATAAPAWANTSAMRLPRPLAAPVTKATLPSRRMMGFVMKKLLVSDSGKTECPQTLRTHSITFCMLQRNTRKTDPSTDRCGKIPSLTGASCHATPDRSHH